EPQHVRALLDPVGDVVELRGELVDVLAVEGRDEGRVQAAHDLVRQPVALVLRLDQAFGLGGRASRPSAAVTRPTTRLTATDSYRPATICIRQCVGAVRGVRVELGFS